MFTRIVSSAVYFFGIIIIRHIVLFGENKTGQAKQNHQHHDSWQPGVKNIYLKTYYYHSHWLFNILVHILYIIILPDLFIIMLCCCWNLCYTILLVGTNLWNFSSLKNQKMDWRPIIVMLNPLTLSENENELSNYKLGLSV